MISGLSGRTRWTIRASRIASSESSTRWSSGPLLLAYPSLKIRYSTWRTLRTLVACSSGVGIPNGTPDDLIVCLALEIRWAMVASPTRKALAISAVVSPPTARRVNAMAEAGVSVGWEHMNSTISVSSCSGTSGDGGSSTAARLSRSRRDCSLRR